MFLALLAYLPWQEVLTINEDQFNSIVKQGGTVFVRFSADSGKTEMNW